MQADSAEFVGAFSVYDGYEFEGITIDPEKTGMLRQYGLNKIAAFSRNSVQSKTLFTYHAVQPDTMANFEYRPCALRYAPEHGVFKTSYFAFPLLMMDNSEGKVQAIFENATNRFY